MRLSWALLAVLLATVPALLSGEVRAAVLGGPVLQGGVEVIPSALTGIELALEGHAGGKKIAAFEGGCGKNVSERLIKRLTRGEVTALMELPAGEDLVLQPGERAGCQLVLTGLRAEVDEATYRVTEARPASAHFSGPDHPRDPARPSAG